MEAAGRLVASVPLFPNTPYPRYHQHSSFTLRASSDLQQGYKGLKPKRDLIVDWVSSNDDVVRSLPIYVGGVSLLAVLFNRTVSGIAPVADPSSSQSRADLLTLGLAVTNVLTGLVWLSIRPKTISVVDPQGVECRRICFGVPDRVVSELIWVWESLLAVSCSRSFVVIYQSICILQIGTAAENDVGVKDAMVVDTVKLMQGSLYQGVMKSGAQSYLANLSLFPGKSELPFCLEIHRLLFCNHLEVKGLQ